MIDGRVHTLASSAKCCRDISGIYLLGAHYPDLNHLGDNNKKYLLARKSCLQLVINIKNWPFSLKDVLVVSVIVT